MVATLRAASHEAGFTMSCEDRTGALLSVLAAAHPGGRILELGTGAGAGTAWLVSGMDATASLVTIELDAGDGGEWLEAYDAEPFDRVFADTWPGKFTHLEQALALVAPGGTYLIDDLLPQPGWPAGHGASVQLLLADLADRQDFRSVRLTWASGLLMAVRSGTPGKTPALDGH